MIIREISGKTPRKSWEITVVKFGKFPLKGRAEYRPKIDRSVVTSHQEIRPPPTKDFRNSVLIKTSTFISDLIRGGPLARHPFGTK